MKRDGACLGILPLRCRGTSLLVWLGRSTTFWEQDREVCCMTDCQKCELEQRTAKLEIAAENQEVRIKELEANVRRSSEDKKEFYRRFDSLTLDNQKHDMEIKSIFEKLDSIDVKTADIDRKVDEINARPAKSVDKFTSAIIGAVGSAVGTGIVALIIYAFMQTI